MEPYLDVVKGTVLPKYPKFIGCFWKRKKKRDIAVQTVSLLVTAPPSFTHTLSIVGLKTLIEESWTLYCKWDGIHKLLRPLSNERCQETWWNMSLACCSKSLWYVAYCVVQINNLQWACSPRNCLPCCFGTFAGVYIIILILLYGPIVCRCRGLLYLPHWEQAAEFDISWPELGILHIDWCNCIIIEFNSLGITPRGM